MEDYREILRYHLENRARVEHSFSLRKISSRAGISHALLSQVLKKKKNLSRDTAIRMADALKLKSKEKSYFVKLTEYHVAGEGKHKEALRDELESQASSTAGQISFEAFRDWYHTAIIELSRLLDFSLKDASRIAKIFKINSLEAQGALLRLIDLKILIPNDKGFLKKKSRILETPTGVPHKYMREHHKQMIRKGLDAIEEQTVQERYISGMTLAIDPAKVAEAGELIEEFNMQMSRLMGGSKKPSAVYQLNIQFFGLGKTK